MPPVTPSATSAMDLLHRRRRRLGLDLLDRAGGDLLLRDGRLLVLADRDPRRRAGQQLPRPRPGGHDEFEGVRELAAIDHENVLTIVSASPCIRCRRARSAMTMLRSRSTAPVTSSLTTTKSYSEKAATSARATCSRC